MQEISIAEMLKCGVHFGHRTSKRHPKMVPFIFGTKNTINIIDLEKTKEKLGAAARFVFDLAQQGKIILFLGSKRQAKDIVKKYAQDCGMPYLVERWVGGLFTNFKIVSGLMKKLIDLKKRKEKGELEKYTKRERLEFDEEIKKLESLVGGLVSLTKLPDAVYIVDLKEEKTAVREANRLKIPIIGLVDTNNNPELTDYPIPANDDALKSIDYITKIIAEAIKEGKEVRNTDNNDKKDD